MIAVRRLALALLAILAWCLPWPALAQFDHTHAAWTALLARHVKPLAGGNASQVDYQGFAADRAALHRYIRSLSDLSAAEFARWNKAQQLAFLANAYNALTIEKVLTRYPNLKSIRDFGRVIGNPWKDEFFTLLGAKHSLDWIEHETLRAPGVYDDPRVHVAVVCASVGCPMLGTQAFTADRLDAQLDEQFRRFMADRSRNRYDPRTRTVELSSIFDWYGKDFEMGHKGFASVQDVVAKYADQLADSPGDRALLRTKTVPIKFLDYDWSLNDVKHP
jgi:hypothetical protein